MMSWIKISNSYYSCNVENTGCIESTLEELLNDTFLALLNNKNVDENIKNIVSTDYNEQVVENPSIFKNLYKVLSNFAVEVELNHSWEKFSNNGNQYGDRYYKDIDKKAQKSLITNSREKNTEKFISYIDKILLKDYNFDNDIKEIMCNANNGTWSTRDCRVEHTNYLASP